MPYFSDYIIILKAMFKDKNKDGSSNVKLLYYVM